MKAHFKTKSFKERAKDKMVEAMDDYCSYSERKGKTDETSQHI